MHGSLTVAPFRRPPRATPADSQRVGSWLRRQDSRLCTSEFAKDFTRRLSRIKANPPHHLPLLKPTPSLFSPDSFPDTSLVWANAGGGCRNRMPDPRIRLDLRTSSATTSALLLQYSVTGDFTGSCARLPRLDRLARQVSTARLPDDQLGLEKYVSRNHSRGLDPLQHGLDSRSTDCTAGLVDSRQGN